MYVKENGSVITVIDAVSAYKRNTVDGGIGGVGWKFSRRKEDKRFRNRRSTFLVTQRKRCYAFPFGLHASTPCISYRLLLLVQY